MNGISGHLLGVDISLLVSVAVAVIKSYIVLFFSGWSW